MANWIIYGKLIYWFHGLNIPNGTNKKQQSIIYRFIWDERKGNSWSIISLPKEEGELGLQDPKILNLVGGIMRLVESGTQIRYGLTG